MKRSFRFSGALLALALMLLAAPLVAQAQHNKHRSHRYDRHAASNTTGIFLQGHLVGAGLEVETPGFGDLDGDGGGFGLKLGYGVTPLLTLYGGFDVAVMDDFNPFALGVTRRPSFGDDFFQTVNDDEVGYFALDLGMQFNFGGGRNKLVPYADIALTYSGLAYELDGGFAGDIDYTISGGGISLGGGLRYFIAPTVALDVSLKGTGAEFEDFTIEGDEVDLPFEFDAGSARFGFGLTWYPTR